MTASQLTRRATALLAAAALVGPMTACASETAEVITPPTMAPEQTVEEACAIARSTVEAAAAEIEQQVQEGISQAEQEIAAGRLPSLDLLTIPSVGDTLAEVEAQVSNEEVHAAVSGVRSAFDGFRELENPDSLLGAASFVTGMGSQLTKLRDSGQAFQRLCGAA